MLFNWNQNWSGVLLIKKKTSWICFWYGRTADGWKTIVVISRDFHVDEFFRPPSSQDFFRNECWSELTGTTQVGFSWSEFISGTFFAPSSTTEAILSRSFEVPFLLPRIWNSETATSCCTLWFRIAMKSLVCPRPWRMKWNLGLVCLDVEMLRILLVRSQQTYFTFS